MRRSQFNGADSQSRDCGAQNWGIKSFDRMGGHTSVHTKEGSNSLGDGSDSQSSDSKGQKLVSITIG